MLGVLFVTVATWQQVMPLSLLIVVAAVVSVVVMVVIPSALCSRAKKQEEIRSTIRESGYNDGRDAGYYDGYRAGRRDESNRWRMAAMRGNRVSCNGALYDVAEIEVEQKDQATNAG